MPSSAVTDRHLGIFVNDERSFADVRARVAAYDEARARRSGRSKKRADDLTHEDFAIGDRFVAMSTEWNGYQSFAYVEVLDSYGRGRWECYTFVRVLHCSDADRVGHIYPLTYGRYSRHFTPCFGLCPFLTTEEYIAKYAGA